MVDSLRPVLEVDKSAKSENAHLPVVEAVGAEKRSIKLVVIDQIVALKPGTLEW